MFLSLSLPIATTTWPRVLSVCTKKKESSEKMNEKREVLAKFSPHSSLHSCLPVFVLWMTLW